ncbi:MAG: hypothetical protein KDC26_13125 [Armatimonadetes bacterium]|nr:hypothetical protein [Armatimonadota bacterium]
MATVPVRIRKRKPKNAKGRLLSDFSDLSNAERALIESCRVGSDCGFGDHKCPKRRDPQVCIRAGILRLLIIGGDIECPVHDRGINLEGAYIEGELDLRDTKLGFPVRILNCFLPDGVNLRRAKTTILGFSGCYTSKFLAAAIDCSADLYFDQGFVCQTAVELIGASIGGDVYFDGSYFRSKSKMKDPEGYSINLSGASIGGQLYFRGIKRMLGRLSLQRVQANTLCDDFESWRGVQWVDLDGFTYDRIVEGPTDSATRIDWLSRQDRDHLGREFKPQPWEQLIKVLREMGHDADARAVAIAKQEAMREAKKFTGIGWLLHGAYGYFAGYGYQPVKTVKAMFFVWFLGLTVFAVAEDLGIMAPSSPIIHSKPKLLEACGQQSDGRLTTWTECRELPKEYTTFNPLIYSLDLILPLVDLQQEKDWAPIVAVNGTEWTIGRALVRAFLWFEILFGWAMSLLLVAVLGNLVKKD